MRSARCTAGAATASGAAAEAVPMAAAAKGRGGGSGPSGLAAAPLLLPRCSRRWQGRPDCATVPRVPLPARTSDRAPATASGAPAGARVRRRIGRLLGPRRRRGRWAWLVGLFLIAFVVRSLYAVDIAPALESQ